MKYKVQSAGFRVRVAAWLLMPLLASCAFGEPLTAVGENGAQQKKMQKATDTLNAPGPMTGTTVTLSSYLQATQLRSTVASGTPPATTNSNSKVVDWHADLLDGASASATPTADTIPIADGNGKLNGWVVFGEDTTAIESLTGTGALHRTSNSPETWALRTLNAGNGLLWLDPGGLLGAPSLVWDYGSAVTTNTSVAAGDWMFFNDVSDADENNAEKITMGNLATSIGTLLNLASTYQPLDATLTGQAAANIAADQIQYGTGANAFGVTSFTTLARTLAANATADDFLDDLGIGESGGGTTDVHIRGLTVTGDLFLGEYDEGDPPNSSQWYIEGEHFYFPENLPPTASTANYVVGIDTTADPDEAVILNAAAVRAASGLASSDSVTFSDVDLPNGVLESEHVITEPDGGVTLTGSGAPENNVLLYNPGSSFRVSMDTTDLLQADSSAVTVLNGHLLIGEAAISVATGAATFNKLTMTGAVDIEIEENDGDESLDITLDDNGAVRLMPGYTLIPTNSRVVIDDDNGSETEPSLWFRMNDSQAGTGLFSGGGPDMNMTVDETIAMTWTSNQTTLNGNTLMGWRLYSEANTAGTGTPNAITGSNTGIVYHNTGSGAVNAHLLPSAIAGMQYSFVVTDADGVRVACSAGDTIRLDASTLATDGDYVESTTQWSSVHLFAIDNNQWIPMPGTAAQGTWTVGP